MALEKAEQTKLTEMLIRLNKKRMTLVAVVALLLQLVNIFDERIQSEWYVLLGVGLIAFASAVYLIFSLVFPQKEYEQMLHMQAVSLVYWCVLTVGICPFVVFDVMEGSIYMNIWFLYGLMPFVPAVRMRECRHLAIFAWAVGAVSVVAGSVQIWQALIVIAIGGSCVLLCIMLHNGYHQAMRAIRVEGDMDGLTRLFSKTAGISRMVTLMSACRRMGRSIAFYYIDIDHFKSYNDTFGHVNGDKALAQVAACIQKCFTRESDILCRLGGEEFAALIPVADQNVALKMGQKLSRMVTNMGLQAGDDSERDVVSVSIGLAICTFQVQDKTTIEALMKAADKQLYVAKSQGRNCIAMEDAVVFRNRG